MADKTAQLAAQIADLLLKAQGPANEKNAQTLAKILVTLETNAARLDTIEAALASGGGAAGAAGGKRSVRPAAAASSSKAAATASEEEKFPSNSMYWFFAKLKKDKAMQDEFITPDDHAAGAADKTVNKFDREKNAAEYYGALGRLIWKRLDQAKKEDLKKRFEEAKAAQSGAQLDADA